MGELRNELRRVRQDLAVHQAEINRLTLDWIENRIDRAEHDRRVAAPATHLEHLRTERRHLHETPTDDLPEDDLEALTTDLFARRQEATDHRTRLRTSGSREDRQQTLAEEVDWCTTRLEDLSKHGTFEDPLILWADCRHCHHRITCLDDDHAVWLHCTVTGLPLPSPGGRGCRAASYDRDGDWNETLPRNKYASPKRGTMTHAVPKFINR
ncbi:hypothetical protein [Kribbella sp. DT2]|uniref:hypothetical protein n=1 Tax=Kribbella sp. DT2 TaxID=3393427 RepID=UPI003CF3EB00